MKRVEDFFARFDKRSVPYHKHRLFFKGRLSLYFINDVYIVPFDKYYLCNIINLSRYVSKRYYDNINTIEKRKNI